MFWWLVISAPALTIASFLACYTSRTFRNYTTNKITNIYKTVETIGKSEIHTDEDKLIVKTTLGNFSLPYIECSLDYDVVFLHFKHDKEGMDEPIENIDYEKLDFMKRIKGKLLFPYRRPKDYRSEEEIHGIIINSFHDKWFYFKVKENNMIDIERYIEKYNSEIEEKECEILAD